MLELLLCSLLTVFPDYLYRRYVQGKRIGREINLYTMWYELRWGITACLMLTVSLITLIFYYHPSTKNVSAIFRTVTILPETTGRVAEVFVGVNGKVKAGTPLFRLDSSEQEAALETAQRQIAEADAEATVAQTELAAADGSHPAGAGRLPAGPGRTGNQARADAAQSDVVSVRKCERLQIAVDGRKGGLDAAVASKRTIEDEDKLAAAGPESQCGGGACAGAGRAGQDPGPGRRRRHRPAVHASTRRHRQPNDTARRHPGPRRGRAWQF